jgi:tetratricopeptide (TPR) repeat protein
MAKVWTLYGRCLAADMRDRDPDLAYRTIVEAREIAEAIGERSTLTWLTLQNASTAVAVGAYDEAERHARAVLASAESVGLARSMGQLALARVLVRTPRLDEAEAMVRQANSAFEAQRNSLFLGSGRQLLATVLGRKGRLGEAEREAQAAAEVVFAPPHRAQVLATLAHLRLELGKTDAALAAAEEAHRALAAGGSVGDGESLTLLTRIRVLAAAGRSDDAQRAAAEARASLAERAARFTDPARRDRFLAIEENRALARSP